MSYNPYSLEGKTVLVTGASSGIGRATALECAKLGATVVVTGRNEERLQEVFTALSRDNGQEHLMLVADLSTADGIKELVAAVPELDGVSSNVGILKAQVPIKFIKNENLEEMMQVNLFSHVQLARDLFKKKKLGKNASYVFTASVGGVATHHVANSIYDMTKAALNSFAKSCAVDFASRGVRCNAICPGMIETPMNAPTASISESDFKKDIESHYLTGRYGKPTEVALTIAFLLSNASSFITGTSIMVDGGCTIVH